MGSNSALTRSFVYRIVIEPLKYWEVLYSLFSQHLILKYRRTLLGYLWTLVNPLLIMGVLTLVFSGLFHSNIKSYAIFLFSGMIPWTYFNNLTVQSSTVFISYESILKKVYLPKLIFPLSIALWLLVDSLLSTATLFALATFMGAKLSWALLFLFVSYGLLFIFSFGIALAVSIITVYLRDMQHLVAIMMQGLFFLTPVFYQEDSLSGEHTTLLQLNPITPFIHLFRDPIYFSALPASSTVGTASLLALFSFLLGSVIFHVHQGKIIFRL
jgi:ABC-type polysaccharide/polyol phosphate export permease